MSCFDCRFYTGEDYLPCTVDRITAAKSPDLGCLQWLPRKTQSCYDCVKFNIKTHHCGVYIAHTAKNPPFDGCSDWEPSKPQNCNPQRVCLIRVIVCIVLFSALFYWV